MGVVKGVGVVVWCVSCMVWWDGGDGGVVVW